MEPHPSTTQQEESQKVFNTQNNTSKVRKSENERSVMLQNSSASDHESTRQTQAGSSRENFQSKNKAPSYSSLVKNPDVKQSQYRSTTNFAENTRTIGAAHSMELTQNSELYEGDQQVNPNPWQTVQRKPKRQIVRGSRGSSSILKGVQENKYLYVGRCDPKVSTDDIMKYMRDQINVEPLTVRQNLNTIYP